ncbi:hypothetical protein C1H46_041624 [Malus baccata]|uniref:Uncharacterized protein n=1 Tax=Malus baccata TaxID=106549 RepID=A0A540KFU2_MALBA|nr:hypothetical protein C1H46_041624 [Malus baccata]
MMIEAAGNLSVTVSSITPSSSSSSNHANGVGAAVSLFFTEYVTVVAFIVAFLVYISSLAVEILQARENTDLSEFMDKISLSSGTLAITLELLIMVPALGWFTITAWSICLVIAVTKSFREIAIVLKRLYQRALEHLLQVFDKLKELFMNIGASASLSNAFNRLKELFVIRNVDNQLAMESDQQNRLP